MIYLANVLPNISCLTGMLGLLSLILIGLVSLIKKTNAYGGEEHEDADNFVKNYFKPNIKWIVICFLISAAIPSERTIYLMMGANYLKTSTFPSKVEMAIEKKINGYLNEKGEK